jgi:hypothetical protein
MAAALLAVTLTSSWVELGGSGSGGGVSATPTQSSAYPSLAMDSQGKPWIAWEELNLTGKWIYLRRWTGSAWEGVGGSDVGSGLSTPEWAGNEAPCLVLDSSDRPVVAWTRNLGVGVARWTGTEWSEYPQPFTWPHDKGSAFSVKVRLDANDRPVVSWLFAPMVSGDESLPYQIYVKRWTDTGWKELGGSASGTGISNALYFAEQPDLAVDLAGNPVVAWAQCDSPGNGICILVKRWDGTSWTGYGGSGTNPGISIGDPMLPGPSGSSPSIVIDPSGNPAVAWHEYGMSMSGFGEIYLRRWDGTAWVEQGSSASGGGISSAANAGARYPSLKIDPTGFPTVAWQNGPAYSTDEIYVRRWNGSEWAELAGSASAGGVSGTGTVSSSFASLALTPGGDPGVAWTEGFSNIGGGTPEIFYRQVGETSPPPPALLQVVAMTPNRKQDAPPKEITLSMSVAPDPITVNSVSIQMIFAGKDEIFGTADDRDVSPAISVSGKKITLDLRDLKLAKGFYRVRVRATEDAGYAGALRDLSGRLLDGEFGGTLPSGNGTPGGDFLIDFDFGATPPGQR